jgi:hypothetical protein
MAVFNFIFIFLFLSFGSIESKRVKTAVSKTERFAGIDESFNSKVPLEFEEVSKLRDPSDSNPLMSAVVGDVIINELMFDPTPLVGLPDREYLELYNPGSAPINLKNWILELGSKQKIFPDIVILPTSYLLVAAPGGAKDLQPFGRVIEISGFVLNNTGLAVSIYDAGKILVDRVAYTPAMHKKGFEQGGYSLERIDPFRLCGQDDNWSTTLSAKGGTPGSANSILAFNSDVTPPQILAYNFRDNSALDVQLSEEVVVPVVLTDFIRNIPEGVVIDSVKLDDTTLLFHIWFTSATIHNGERYKVLIHGLADECGNVMTDQELKFGYYLPVKSDLLISEVLFNPFPGGSDFVEIYNNCSHETDLSELYLATRDETKILKQISQVSTRQNYLSANAYLAVTKSREGVLCFYRSKCEACILEAEKFPTLTNVSGCVVLLNKNQEVIDEMNYSDAMHHPLITDTEGISLERISFLQPASRKDNWQSAAKSAGFATPGYQNSVLELPDSTDQLIRVEPLIFTPNGDGINDELKISVNPGHPGDILNITILNYAGYPVRNLVNNVMTGSNDHFFWDGLNDDYQRVQLGIYILNILLFEQSGKRHLKRVACVLSDRL